MAYNPSDHKAQNQPFGVGAIPLNAKSLYYDSILLKYRPFQNMAEVNTYFSNLTFRDATFDIIVNTGGVLAAGVITGGTNDAYWYKDGTADINLVLKTNSVDLSGYYTKTQIDAFILAINTALGLHIADTNNPHLVTKTQIGLGNVDNTSDLNKPVSNAQLLAFVQLDPVAFQSGIIKIDGMSFLKGGISGSDLANGDLTLISTSNANKGLIKFGNSAYDEDNNSLLIGDTTHKFAAITVAQLLTELDYHGFEDWSTLNQLLSTTDGYSAFDAKPTNISNTDSSHFAAYQARLQNTGSGNITSYIVGYEVNNLHSGAGNILTSYGVHIKDLGGAGALTDNYGIYIEPILRGSGKNYALFSAGGLVYFGGVVIGNNGFEAGAGGGFNGNLYYSGGFKYRGDGYGFSTYSSGGGVQLFNVAPAGLKDATAVPGIAFNLDQTTGYMNIKGGTALAKTPLQVAGNITVNADSGLWSNLYYNAGYKYLANGYGFATYGGGGLLQHVIAGLNAGGAGAVAAITNWLNVRQSNGDVNFPKKVSIGTEVPQVTSKLEVNDNITLPVGTGLFFNSYSSGGFKYRANGFACAFYGTSDGGFQFSVMANNAAGGAGAAGTETKIWKMFNSGNFVPDTDNSADIGTSSFKVKDIYVNGLKGTPTAPTPAVGTNNTQIATTAFVAAQIPSGSFSGAATSTTSFVVTIGQTMANTTYKVNVTPTGPLGAAPFYISAKTTTTFTVTYLTGLTGTLNFDWSIFR